MHYFHYFLLFLLTRDPNFEETLSAFENSVQWAVEGKFTDQDVEEAKISVLAQVSVMCKICLFFFYVKTFTYRSEKGFEGQSRGYKFAKFMSKFLAAA